MKTLAVIVGGIVLAVGAIYLICFVPWTRTATVVEEDPSHRLPLAARTLLDRAEFEELLEKLRTREITEAASPELRELLTKARNVHGDTLLHILAAEGDLEAVTTLVKLGIDINARNNFGSVAIETPAWSEEREVVRYLLLNGARLDIRDSTGSTTAENLEVLDKHEMLRWMDSIRTEGQQDPEGKND